MDLATFTREQRQAEVDQAVAHVRQQGERTNTAIDELLAKPVREVDKSTAELLKSQAAALNSTSSTDAAARNRQHAEQSRMATAVAAEKASNEAATVKKLGQLGEQHGRAVVATSCDVELLLRLRTNKGMIHAASRTDDRRNVREAVQTATGIRVDDQWFFANAAYQDGLLRGIAAGMKAAGI
jgi:hypothetical protein